MGLLVIGVLLWSCVHLYPSLFPDRRAMVIDKLGNKYQGIFAITIVFSIVLMVMGWRTTVPEPVYATPAWGRHLHFLLMIIAIALLGAGSPKGVSRIKQFIRHPMLTGVAIWGIGHLLANGDIRSLILFGGMTTWAIVNQITLNRRDGHWEKPTEVASLKREAILVVATVVVYLVLFMTHRFYTGMPLV